MAEVASFREQLISQIPALQLLMALGYEYLTPEQALRLRGGAGGVASAARCHQPQEPDPPLRQPALAPQRNKALLEPLLTARPRCSSVAPTAAVALRRSTRGCLGAHIVVS